MAGYIRKATKAAMERERQRDELRVQALLGPFLAPGVTVKVEYPDHSVALTRDGKTVWFVPVGDDMTYLEVN